jgi:taurine--2-oxoglutarate transaminase
VSGEREVVLHSWSVQADWRAPTVVGGHGARLTLEDGREILDMSSLAECSNLGHQHPALVAAIRAQAERLCFVTNAWGAAPRAELAQRLLELSGFEGGRVFFTLGGADANEHAVKILRQAAGRPGGLVITRDRSYHGATYLAMALSGDSRTRAQVDAQALGIRHGMRIAARSARRTNATAAARPHAPSASASTAKVRIGSSRSRWSRTPAATASSRPTITGPSCVQ